MSDPVTLLLPVEERYRALAGELARKYVDIAGGSADDAQALSNQLGDALTQLTGVPVADDGAEFSLGFQVEAGQVEILVRCGERTLSVTHAVSARNVQ